MSARKQQLLKRHRKHKRIALLVALVLLLLICALLSWWLVLPLILLGWVAHEAWFADHLFYRPQDDYRYDFPPDARQLAVRLEHGRLRTAADWSDGDTLILEVRVTANWLGRFLDRRPIGLDDHLGGRGLHGLPRQGDAAERQHAGNRPGQLVPEVAERGQRAVLFSPVEVQAAGQDGDDEVLEHGHSSVSWGMMRVSSRSESSVSNSR